MSADFAKDYIYQCYLDKERYIYKTVKLKNQSLVGKTKVRVCISDCFPKETLYSDGDEILVTEQHLTEKEKISKSLLIFDKSIYGIYYMPDYNWDIDISRSLSFFVNRVDVFRQFFIYKLFSMGLDQDAFLSFNGSNLEGRSCLDHYDKIYQDFYFPHYQEIHSQIRPLIPYRNFTETGNLCDVILQTKIHLVAETYHERTDSVTFSEKIFRSLQTPRPWVLFAATGSVEILRSMGFYVYDDFVDHSYDQFDTSQTADDRFNAVLDQTVQLAKSKITPAMINHWKTKTLENRQILKEWNSVWKQRVDSVLEQAFAMAKDRG